MISHKIYVVVIITSSICFPGIICHYIVLCYLLIVLRLLHILQGIVIGKKMGSFFVQLIGGLQYTIIIGSYMQGVTKWAICCNYHIASNYSRSCINAGSRSISGLGIVCYNNKTHNIALHVSSASIRIHH